MLNEETGMSMAPMTASLDDYRHASHLVARSIWTNVLDTVWDVMSLPLVRSMPCRTQMVLHGGISFP